MPKPSYLLTEEGLRKVKAAFVKFCGKPSPSKEEMGRCAELDSGTIRKLLERTGGVNRGTLERLCSRFGWDLELELQEGVHYIAASSNPMVGRTLRQHYRIIKYLGKWEFGETYLSKDEDIPDPSLCIVKQLRSESKETTKRLNREARVLRRLGKHSQIPQLFACFEENESFYLVHEFIEGKNLEQELMESQLWTETKVVTLLRDILEILKVVHQDNVIHRNINPQSLIRRSSDGKLVLTDFGAVLEISMGETRTFAGSKHYIPPEQSYGTPQLCSDIYSVGIIGIQAFTGLHPKKLKANYDTGNIIWRDKAQVKVSPDCASILDKMVDYSFKTRYQSAGEVLQALQGLKISE
ncbi:MAG: serine/threonine protein kinase [Symploca sp. SIO2C1]|nr:serine/threonine protein kinase [Symploca sp. SIO2C1]